MYFLAWLTAPPAPPKPGQCPVVEPSGFGICVQECEDDWSCDGDAKCCANGCGQTCMSPIQSMNVIHYLVGISIIAPFSLLLIIWGPFETNEGCYTKAVVPLLDQFLL